MIRLSASAGDLLVSQLGLAQIFSYGNIWLYPGPMPASPEVEPTSAPIGVICRSGTYPTTNNAATAGLLFRSGPVRASITDYGDWALLKLAAGTVGWWRFTTSVDGTGAPRMDGAVGTSLSLPSAVFAGPATAVPIRSFILSFPLYSGA